MFGLVVNLKNKNRIIDLAFRVGKLNLDMRFTPITNQPEVMPRLASLIGKKPLPTVVIGFFVYFPCR